MNFSVEQLGRQISQARKQKNWTQSQLAEKLLVSYQAVSSWENGHTAPDISKLSELAALFEISIDELLGHESFASAIKKVNAHEALNKEEVLVIAPYTGPKQLDDILERVESSAFKIEDMVKMAPFASDDFLDDWIDKQKESIEIRDIVALAPFLSEHQLDELMIEVDASDMSSIRALLPFLSDSKIHSIAQEILNSEGSTLKDLTSIAPFMSEADLNELVLHAAKDSSLKSLVSLMPFVSEGVVDQLLLDRLSEEDLDPSSVTALAPFLKRETIQKLIETFSQKGRLNEAKGLFPFM